MAVITVEFILEFIDFNAYRINPFNDTLVSMGKDANNETGVGREILFRQFVDLIVKILSFQVLINVYIKPKFKKYIF